MTLSNGRQQFLPYETHGTEEIQYGRRGGVFISHCICISFIIFAVVVTVIVGVIVHFTTYYKLAEKTENFWDETEPFGQTGTPSPDLRLPTYITPSFYRLKIKADLENSLFSGDVFITLKANRQIKEIILHSKNLTISSNAKLTELTYEKVETLHTKIKREAPNDTALLQNNTTIELPTNITIAETSEAVNFTTASPTSMSSMETSKAIHSTTLSPTNMSSTEPILPVDKQITYSSVRSIKIIGISDGAGDRLVLALASPLTPGVDYILQLSFEGVISNSLTGFYKSTYTNSQNEVRQLAVTQFEPTSARAAFPCFDEPAFKAKFEISIAHLQNITALSNMKVAAQETISEEPGWQWTHFDRSVEMSTYLVAYIITDFQSLETSYLSKDNVTKPIRIWCRPELLNKTKYALAITPKLISYYEDVFGVPYALDKLDLVAVPEFSSGAMENWGLITFRETTLLWDETENVPRDKQGVAIDIAHELAHQWFGNLVTMRWWTDLWLNEGFATYIEYVGVDHIEPEWQMLESFTKDKMDLLRSDSLKNTSPVSRTVTDASEISQKFDEISYTKGANLIRMLNHTISEELFHKGLLIYLNDWKYSNAEENDLWAAMSKAVKSDPSLVGLVKFMNSWTRQAGYPVVNVNRNYQTGVVELEQRLFTGAKDPYQKMVDQLWHIPISYTSLSAPLDQWSTKPKTWFKERISVFQTTMNATEPLYMNVDAVGYYRVNYDKRNWELLAEVLKSGAVESAVTKAQLIDDAFNLAKSGQLEYGLALGLTSCVIRGEDSKTVWDQLLNNMAFLKHNLRETSGYLYFQDYMKIILKKQLERLNYGLDKPKDDNEAFLIENLVMWECYVESPRCLSWARDQFENWVKHPDVNNNPIPSYLRSLVYNMALRHGGRREFDILWNAFLNSSDPSVKSLIINNLSATRDESIIAMLLEKSLSDIPKQYAVAVWGVEPGPGTRIAQRFLIDHFDTIYEKFTAMDTFMFPAVLNGAFGFIRTNEELDRLKTFALEHKEKLMPMSQTLQKMVDTANLRIEWVKKYAQGINKWFQDYINNKSPSNNNITTGNEIKINTTTVPIPYLNSTNSIISTTGNPSLDTTNNTTIESQTTSL